MGKVILEFDSNEEREEIDTAINGFKWKIIVWDLDQHLRSRIKHESGLSEEEYKILENTRETLNELIHSIGVKLD